MRSLLFLLSLSLLFFYTAAAQEFGTGLLLDPSLYEHSPKAAPLTRAMFINIPNKFSMKSFAPTPGNQGLNATCAGWSCAYGARTILAAINREWNKEVIDSNSFSPSFIYNQIRPENNCNGGVSLIDALETLKQTGSLTIRQFGLSCAKTVSEKDIAKASENKVLDYRELFNFQSKNKVLVVKKALIEYKPVVVAMDCPVSFEKADTVWIPYKTDYKYWGRGHAVVVVGYNDEYLGGAFEVMNSWGTGWGKGGFTWVKYEDFKYFFKYGFEIIDRRSGKKEVQKLSGKLSFRLSNGDTMRFNYNGSYFKVLKPYPSGTRFELLLSNNQSAYVYVLGSDMTNRTTKLFPYKENMSPLLPYNKNEINLPDDISYFALDSTTGVSYMIFLYSLLPIDFDSLLNEINSSTGTMLERIQKVFNSKHMISKSNIYFVADDFIKFEANFRQGYILPILVAINHINK